MQPRSRALFALFAAAIAAIPCAVCPTRLDHPILFAARLLRIDENRGCTVYSHHTGHLWLTVLTFVPVALLVASAVLSIVRNRQVLSERLWSWSAVFTAIFVAPMLAYAVAVGVDSPDGFYFSAGDVVFVAALSAPLWSFGLSQPADRPKSVPWLSFGESAATALLVTVAVLCGVYVYARSPTNSPRLTLPQTQAVARDDRQDSTNMCFHGAEY